MNLALPRNVGGYAFCVWTSYGIGLAVLALNIVQPFVDHVSKLFLRNLS
ncbi:MAG: heme exporter protein CcmD [Alcanivorax sp.]|nr:heme exporter protein CcmD [Alcanivorax sp.]